LPAFTLTSAHGREYERWIRARRRQEKSLPAAKDATAPKEIPLAPATVAKQLAQAKQFFADAVERGLIEANPFACLKTGSRPNRTRDHFVSQADTAKLLDACPGIPGGG
jgi:site-specific recombinase XerD